MSKGLKLYGCSVSAAKQLELSAVDIAQLAHAADECILCREGYSDALFPNDLILGRTCYNEAVGAVCFHDLRECRDC